MTDAIKQAATTPFAKAMETIHSIFAKHKVSPASTPAISDPLASFHRYGLLAERDLSGVMQCNLPIVGGVGGQKVAVMWDQPSKNRLLLALSVVLYMTAIPDDSCAPLSPGMTRRYRNTDAAYDTLDDGTRFQIRHIVIAKLFEEECLATCSGHDALTIPMDVIKYKLEKFIRETYPD